MTITNITPREHLAKQTPQLKGEAKLRAELAKAWKDIETLSPIELMVRNPNLASFVKEWTDRATKAEAEIANLKQNADWNYSSAKRMEAERDAMTQVSILSLESLEATKEARDILIQQREADRAAMREALDALNQVLLQINCVPAEVDFGISALRARLETP